MKKVMFLLVGTILIFSSCCSDGDGSLLLGTLVAGADSYEEEKINEELLTLREEFIWRKDDKTTIKVAPELNAYFSKDYSPRLIDVESDELIWENINLKEIPTLDNSHFGEDFIVSTFSNGHTVINKTTGEIIYQENLTPPGCETNNSKITGIGDLFFQVGTIPLPNEQYQDVVFMGNVNAPDKLEIVLKPDFQTEKFDRDVGLGAIGGAQPFLAENGDIMLAITYSEPTDVAKEKISIGLWNMNTEEWIYKDIPFMNYFDTANLHLKNDKLYCYNSLKIACYNLEDGSLKWEKESDLTQMKFLFVDNHIVVNNNGLEILNSQNGEVYRIYQGTIFHYIASSKYLYVPLDELKIYDIKTGKLVKSIPTPYTTYPVETPNYFRKLSTLKIVEDKENDVDYVFMTKNEYNLKMKIEHN